MEFVSPVNKSPELCVLFRVYKTLVTASFACLLIFFFVFLLKKNLCTVLIRHCDLSTFLQSLNVPLRIAEFVSFILKYQLLYVFLPTSGHFGFQQHSCSILGLQISIITLCTSCEEALVMSGFVPVTWSLHGTFCKYINSLIVYITCRKSELFFVHFCAGLGSSWSYLLAVVSICSCPAVTNNKQPISLPTFVIWNLCYTECKNCSSLKCCVFGLFNSPPTIH